ncbi:MAG: hypothetical protein M0P97_01340 [Candidatus Moranbacteria bacterium]|jgi:hypothetical protein|nr:hypothetical protein [Candidatus Moranbacteria bacterium]
MKQKIKNNSNKKNITKVLLTFVIFFFVFNLSLGINGDFLNQARAASFVDSVIDSTLDSLQNGFIVGFNYLLYGVWLLLTFFIWIAGLMFDWSINPTHISGVIRSDGVYSGWLIVRDFMNLSFILVLLFSAFSTVFQIDKYHLLKKNILLMVVLMALLVNFSFPVSRFIIDTTNVTMYFFVEQAFPGYNYTSDSISAAFLDNSKLVKLVLPKGVSSVKNSDSDLTVKLLILIVFSFLMAITLMAMAGIFLVRIIALAMIIIFSPLGFVGPIFPSFSKMGEWWDYLFKYALIGPVMMFMLLLSLRLMDQLGNTKFIGADSIDTLAANYQIPSGNGDLLATAAFFFIPMIILWSGMLIASKIYGASAIISFAKGVGTKFRKAPGKAAAFGLGAFGVSGGAKKAVDDFKKTGTIAGRQLGIGRLKYGGSEAKALREEKMGARMSSGKWSAGDEAQRDYERKKSIALRKEWKDTNQSEASIQDKLKNGNSIEKKAAAMEMAEKNGFGRNDAFFASARAALGEDSALKEVFDKNVKEKRIDLHIKTKIEEINADNNISTINKASEINTMINKAIGGMGEGGWTKQQNVKAIVSDDRMRAAAADDIAKRGDKFVEKLHDKMSGENIEAGNVLWRK